MALHLDDTFIRAGGESSPWHVINHTPTIVGPPWAPAAGVATRHAIISDGFVQVLTNATHHTVSTLAPTGAGEIRRKITVKSLTGIYGVSAMVHDSQVTWYWANVTLANGASTVKIQYKINNGATQTVATYNLPANPTLDAVYELVYRFNNDDGAMSVLWGLWVDGVDPPEVITTSSTAITADGRIGMLDSTVTSPGTTTGALTSRFIFQDSTAPPALLVTYPAPYDADLVDWDTGLGEIIVEGSIANVDGPVDIEAKFGDMPYTLIASGVTNGTFTGDPLPSYSHGGTLYVRIKDQDYPTARATVANYMVGPGLGFVGQSLPGGRITGNRSVGQEYHGPMPGWMVAVNDEYGPLVDPVNRATDTNYSFFADGAAAGSHVLTIAAMVMEELEMPVIVWDTAKGNQASPIFAAPTPAEDDNDIDCAYRMSSARTAAISKGKNGFLYVAWQGESGDALTYEADWRSHGLAFYARHGVRPIMPLLQDTSLGLTDTNLIRTAQQNLINEGTFLQGPDLRLGPPVNDGYHWTDPDDAWQISKMWADNLIARLRLIPRSPNVFDQPRTIPAVAGSWGEYIVNTLTGINAKTTLLPASPANEVTVAAVKAKTDLIPASPASETTVAAVKAKTDLIPASPASETTVTAVKAKTDLIPASPASETTSAAIKAKTDALPASPASEVTSAAIKTRTDLIPNSPAAVGSAMTLAANAVNAAAMASDAIEEIAFATAEEVGDGGGGGGTTKVYHPIQISDNWPNEMLRLTEGDTNAVLEYTLRDDAGTAIILVGNEEVTFRLRKKSSTEPEVEADADIAFASEGVVRFAFSEEVPVPDDGSYDATWNVGGVTYPIGRRIPVTIVGSLDG